ncbi:MAG: SgcJ/EcaC family oxidoreductase [Ferruginibacter sp.]
MENSINEKKEIAVRELHQAILKHWNDKNAAGFAAMFAVDGNAVGFDGSQMNGQQQINKEMNVVFANHDVASYIGVTREIRALSTGVFILRAVAGMVPPGKLAINSEVNAVQTLIAQEVNGSFKVALFHNTPAAFHGRPELSIQLTAELQQALDEQGQ